MDFAAHLSQSVSKVEADTSIPKYQGHGAAPEMNGERLQMRLALAEALRRGASGPLPGRTGGGRWKRTEGEQRGKGEAAQQPAAQRTEVVWRREF